MKNLKTKLLCTVMTATIFLCVACQETPDHAIVRSKESGLTQSAQSEQEMQTQPLRDRLGVPLEWHESITLNDKLIVDINADIIVPEVYNVATFKAIPQEITQGMANEYMEIFFGDESIYQQRPYDIITQEDILNDVKRIRNYLEEIKKTDLDRYNEELPEWEDIIKERLNSLENYPETYELVPSEGTFQTGKKYIDMPDSSNPDIQKINVQADLGNEYPAKLNIAQSESFKDGYMYFSDGRHINMTEVKLKIDQTPNPIDLEKSLNEAVDIAYGELDKLGFENYYFQGAYYSVLGSGPYITSTLPAKETNPYFYDLYFSQKIDDIPLSYTSPFRTLSTGEKFSEGWGPEVIQVFVDDDGVFAFNWLYPTKISDEIDHNVSLLNFNEIKRIIVQNLQSIYMPVDVEDYIGKIGLQIEKIEFAYAKCLKQNSDSEYILTPCWNVYGNVKEFYNETVKDPNLDGDNAYVQTKPMGVLLVVNAINGSLLNTNMSF